MGGIFVNVLAKPQPIELKSLLADRKLFYQFFYLLFQQPLNSERLGELRSFSNLRGLAIDFEGGTILWHNINHLSKHKLTAEQAEYRRLFIGPGPLAAPPWESFYLSKGERCIFEVRKAYSRHGIKFRMEDHEPDDHLLFELEYMIFLAEQCIHECGTGRLEEMMNETIRFLEEHLLRWIPLFSKRLLNVTNSELYVGAALLLSDFISNDYETLVRESEAIKTAK